MQPRIKSHLIERPSSAMTSPTVNANASARRGLYKQGAPSADQSQAARRQKALEAQQQVGSVFMQDTDRL